MESVNIFTSFVAGVISFLSPCVLPLVPGYISYISGLTLEELTAGGEERARTTLFRSFLFVLGFTVVFTALGASASAIGKFLSDYQSVLSKMAGVVIILFGLNLTRILPIQWLYYEKTFQWGHLSSKNLGPFFMGFAFAFGWTPCIGPILAGILALAATQETVLRGTLLLFVYSLGLGIPFILTGWSVHYFLKFFNRYKKFIHWGEIFSGILLMGIGLLIFTNKLTLLLKFLPKSLFKFAV